MISSVQNIQTSIKNAPENVLGMVKGISDNLTSNNSSDSINKFNSQSSVTSLPSPQLIHNQSMTNLSSLNTSNLNNTAKIQIDKKDISSIDKTILNNDDMVKLFLNDIFIRFLQFLLK